MMRIAWLVLLLLPQAALGPPAVRAASSARAGQNEKIAAAFAEVFRAEAGRWVGSCLSRGEQGTWSELEASFVITHSPDAPHEFSGNYGGQQLSGSEVIEGGRRRGVMRTPAGEQVLDNEVLLVHIESEDSYFYRETIGPAPDSGVRRFTIVSRMGDLQVNLQLAERQVDGALVEVPVSFCSYRRTD
jgi:hypothetical protein